jgi:hypothetical protein
VSAAPDPLDELAVVVPVAPGDDAWRPLLADLGALPPRAGVLLAAAEPLAPAAARDADAALAGRRWRWLVAPRGRARQLNAGARAADGAVLWFLHADSRVAPADVAALRDALRAAPGALHYFDLAFLPDGPRGMRLNAAGAWVRSRWLGMPFGDQGLCVRRDVWARLGGFDEAAPYGEDHLFVWRARQAGVPLRPTGGVVRTSARRYREHGWGRTTLRHVRLTARQAFPEWVALLRARAARPGRPG